MINVKDVSGVEQSVPSNGKTTAALTLGIIGTGLAALGGGGLNLLNGGGNECMVTEKEFYQTELANRDREFQMFSNLNDKLCSLAQRVAVDETAIAWSDKLTQKNFECLDGKVDTTYLLSKLYTDSVTCNFMPATKTLRPEQISDPYHGFNLRLGYAAPNNYGFDPYYNGGC